MPENNYRWTDTKIDIILDEEGKNKEQDSKSYTYFMSKLDIGLVKESTIKKLYENGFINYMRTDSKKYSKEFLKVCFQFIEQKYGDEYSNKTLMNEENDDEFR